MASYLRPRRGKEATAKSQNIVLKRGEIFFISVYNLLPSIVGSSPSLSLPNFLKSLMRKMADIMKARVSDIGKLYHTPSEPSSRGRRYRRGRSIRICLLRDRNMDLLTIPRHWKRLVEIIWNPIRNTMQFILLRPFAEMSSNSLSVVKILHAARGKITDTTNRREVTMVASMAVFLKTSLTLEYFLAP